MSVLRKAAIAALFSLAAAAAPASAAGVKPPPISAYGALPALEEVAISQDGSRLAYITVTGETRTLVMQTIDRTPLGAVETGDTKVRDIQWAGNDYVIITTSVTASIPEWLTGKSEWWYAISYDLKKKKLWNLAGYIPNTANIISSRVDVRRYDGEWVAVFNTFDRYKGSVLRRVPLDGRPSAVLEDFHDKTDGYLLDPQTLKPFAEARFDERSDEWALHVKDGPGWPKIYSMKSELDTPALAGLDRNGEALLLFVQTDRGYELMTLPRQGGALTPATDREHLYGGLFDPTSDRLIGLVHEVYGVPQYAFFDPAAQANWEKVLRLFKGQRAVRVSRSLDNQKLVVRVEGPQNAGTFYYIDFTTNEVSVIGEQYPGVTPMQVAQIKPYDYKAADGLVIPGFLTLPPGREPQNLPLIVLPHGGPQVHDAQQFDWWAQAMASRGYAVLQPNYRGSSGYGKDHTAAGHGQWGRKMQTDLSDGVRALARDGVIDPARVCIVGASYGGYAAMAGPTIDPGVYRCAVAVAGVADLPEMLLSERMDAGGKRDNGASNYWRRFMGAENDRDPSLIEISPTRMIDRLDVPIMLIHGKDDTVVPYRQSVLFADAARKAGKPVEFVTLDGEDHWLSRNATRLQMLEESIAFLERNNPPD